MNDNFEADFDAERCPFVFEDEEQCVQFAGHVKQEWNAEHVHPGDDFPVNPGLVKGIDYA